MSSDHAPEPRNFSPKQDVKLDPPKSDPITVEELSKADGEDDLPDHAQALPWPTC
jgi:hypothetical protein